jgi:hypothetical protein
MAPSTYSITTKDDLLRKFVAESWRERLAQYRYETWPATQIKTIEKWWNGENLQAFVLTYRNATGVSTVVRQLRDGDTMFYIP